MIGLNLLRFSFVSCLLSVGFVAHAECNNLAALEQSPASSDLVVRFSPARYERVAIVGARVVDLSSVSSVRLLPSVEDVANEPFSREGGGIIYLERSESGKLRICREELWSARGIAIKEEVGRKYVGAVAKVAPFYTLSKVVSYLYDGASRLVEVRASAPALHVAGAPAPSAKIWRTDIQYCAIYDVNGRIRVATKSGNIGVKGEGFSCQMLENDPGVVASESFAYSADGRVSSFLTRVPYADLPGSTNERAAGAVDSRGVWWGMGEIFLDDPDVEGGRTAVLIEFDQKRGLIRLEARSGRVALADSSSLFKQRSAQSGAKLTYAFPFEYVPINLAVGYFDGITGYSRVRGYQHRNGNNIFEVFSPRAKSPRERQWRSLDLNRQENYDANGKLTRVILSGLVPADAYTENLRAYAEKGVLKLTPLTSGYSSYRVYDYDAAGKETLSFVCWRYEVSTNKPYAHFPWWEPDPRPKRSREAELQYGRTQVGTRCGTPDGKVVAEGMGPVKKLMETRYGFGTTKLGLPGE